MIVIGDIEYLHIDSFQEVIDLFLPSAKTLHIFYGCQWTNLFYEPMPKNIDVRWSKLYSLDPETFFDRCIEDASKADAGDTLFLIDISYTAGKNIMDKYKHIYISKNSDLDFPLSSEPMIYPYQQKSYS